MTGYTKLFGSIVASTIWREDDKTRIVWITMLAIANKHGEVEASVPGLADLARVSVSECRAALEKLSSPDIDSRSMEYEGRRIEKVEGGWRLINHAKYREKLSTDERREYLARKQREHRARQQSSTNVNSGQSESTPSTHTEADTNTKAEAEATTPPSAKAEEREALIRDFDAFWKEYPRKRAKDDAIKAWKKHKPDLAVVLNKIREFKRSHDWTKDGGRFIPYPASWLNATGWEDELKIDLSTPQSSPQQPKLTQDQRFAAYVEAVLSRGGDPMNTSDWFHAGQPKE